MANDSSNFFLSNPFPLVAMALLAAGIVVRTIPLESARPGDADRAQQSIADTQDVPARLWQDPFSAVNAAKIAKGKDLQATAHLREPARLRKTIEGYKKRNNDVPVQVLGVMISTSAFAEDAEERRRARYAVIQALSVTGYTPNDPEALGYIDIEKAQDRQLPAQVPFEWFLPDTYGELTNKKPVVLVLWLEENVLGRRPAPRIARLIQTICYDKPNINSTVPQGGAAAKSRGSSIPEGVELIEPGGPMCEPGLLNQNLSFLGPRDSNGLMMLARHIRADHWNDQVLTKDAEWPQLKGYRFNFFSPFATNPDAELKAYLVSHQEWKYRKDKTGSDEKTPIDVPDRMSCVYPNNETTQADCEISIIRTIGGDDKLANLMSSELALRGVNGRGWECNDRIVIVAERDTTYGRVLAEQFRSAMKEMPGCPQPAADKQNTKTGEPLENLNEKDQKKAAEEVKRRDTLVWEVGYLRGLDGVVAETGAEKAERKQRNASSNTKLDIDSLDAPTALKERAEGRSQFDYVRRLAQQIRDNEKIDDFGSGALDYLRLEGAPKIKAIGVLGHDVYDKLLILQALHSVFPYAILFTTDLDARLSHSDQSEWTRNLVVASNYGFRLRKSLQLSTPPFRNGYQTSTYLATLLAVRDATVETVKRTPDGVAQVAAIDTAKANKQQSEDKPHVIDRTELNERLKQWLQPTVYELGRTREIPLTLPKAYRDKVNEAAASPGCSLRNILQCDSINVQDIEPAHTGALALLTFGAGLVLVLLSSQYALTTMHRRFGLSIVGVALAAITIALVAGGSLRSTIIASEEPFYWFEGVSLWPSLFALVVAFLTAVASAAYIDGSFRKGKQKITKEFFPSKEGVSDTAGMLAWHGYDANTKTKGRRSRVLPVAGVCFVFFLLLILLGKQHLPFRGETAWICAVVGYSIASFALLYLVFQVIDIVKHTTRFVKWMASADTHYPDVVRRKYATDLGLSDTRAATSTRDRTQVLEDWIDFRLVVQLTTEVERFIYFPFLVLLLFAIAQIRLFDDWQISPSILVVVGIFVACVIYCSYSLRRAAEAARARALAHYNACLLRGAGGEAGVCGPTALIESLIARIRETRAGAFRPFFQTPALQSLLIPFGGMGGYSIIEYLFARGM